MKLIFNPLINNFQLIPPPQEDDLPFLQIYLDKLNNIEPYAVAIDTIKNDSTFLELLLKSHEHNNKLILDLIDHLPVDGQTGEQGIKGDTGSQGIQGLKGDTGDKGVTGNQGDKGLDGVKGDNGEQGIQGNPGVKGDTGATGVNGINGIDGQQGIQGLPGIDGKFSNWNNITKEEHPMNNVIGYNTDENRIEFYLKDLDEWFYLWSEFIAITETPQLPYFLEDFEIGWLITGTFNNIFNELFETNWFIDNIFIGLFAENFQGIDW